MLDSLRASLGARGVALLRHDEPADGYEVVGRAGEGFGGKFNFPAPGNALHRVTADGTISILEASTFGALAYHIRPESTVGHAVALAVNSPIRHLLVADVHVRSAQQQHDLVLVVGQRLHRTGQHLQAAIAQVQHQAGWPLAELHRLEHPARQRVGIVLGGSGLLLGMASAGVM